MNSKYEIPDRVTMGDIRKLRKKIKTLHTIGEWKKYLKEYAIENKLTDQQAIAMSRQREIVRDF